MRAHYMPIREAGSIAYLPEKVLRTSTAGAGSTLQEATSSRS